MGKVVIKELFFKKLNQYLKTHEVGFDLSMSTEGFLKIWRRSKGVMDACGHLQKMSDVVKKAITSPQQLGIIHCVSFPLVTFMSNYFIPGMKFLLISCY